MKYFLAALFAFSNMVNACGDDEYRVEAFAELVSKSELYKLNIYRIFVPQKKGEYLLTSIVAAVPEMMRVHLEFEEVHDNKKYYFSYLWLKESLEKKLEVKLKHSRGENGGMLLCGEYVDYTLADLLKAGLNKTEFK